MPNSKRFDSLPSEERAALRKKYQTRYKERHPERAKEASARYKAKNRDEVLRKAREYRQANKERINQKTKEERHALKIRAIEHMGGLCKRCNGTFHPASYDFHHRENKEFALSGSSMRRRTWEQILAELAKCELLCSNCHRVEHSDDW